MLAINEVEDMLENAREFRHAPMCLWRRPVGGYCSCGLVALQDWLTKIIKTQKSFQKESKSE